MKHLIKPLLTALLLLCSIIVNAHDFEVNGIYYNILSEEDKTVEVTFRGDSYLTYYDEYRGAVVIPVSVKYNEADYCVTSIGKSAFEPCDDLTRIEIPSSVTSIGERAFENCDGLTSITIGNSVTSIGNKAFYGCSSLKEVHINDLRAWCKIDFSTNESNPLNYAKNLFLNGNKLSEIIIPDDITEIKGCTFYNCSSLTSITIPNSVTSIGGSAFKNCSSLTSIEIPNSVTSIGNNAFAYCSNLTSIAIPNSVTSIGENAFYSCSSLKEVHINDLSAWCKIDFSTYDSNPLCYANNLFLNGNKLSEIIIPDDITEIKRYTFYNCSSLTSIEIPNSVTSIGEWAFRGCSSLTSIEIPSSVTSIGNDAFRNCDDLTRIEIPSSVTSIGESAFEGCSGLKEVHINDLSAWCKIDFSTSDSNPLYYAKNLFLNGNKISELTIPDDIKEIRNYAFRNCSSLTSITIPNNITSIRKSAFEYCSNLEKLYLGNSIESIGSYAFGGCNSLLEIYASSKKAIKCNENVFSSDAYNNACLFVPIGRKFAYEKTTPWNNFYIVEMEFSDSYQLIYMVDGEVYKSFNLNYGAIIEPIAEPTKEGHTFSGWSEIPATMPANDVIIEGSFSINSYTVTFMVDGEVYETMAVEYGAEIELPTPPEKEGYIFTGWIGVPATMPAEDIVIEGRFEVDTTGINTVTLDLEKDEVYNLKGQRITESENLTRGIYIVNGKKVYIK